MLGETANTFSSGTMLWETGPRTVVVNDGIFVSTLSPTIELGTFPDLWLEITIDNKTLSPREKIMAQAYALHSQSAELLSVSSGEIQVKIGTSTAFIGISKNRLYVKSPTPLGNEYIGVPAGTVIAFAGSNIPVGYFECKGDWKFIAEYPELYSAIGSTYNDGESRSGQFRLPDFRGMFLRGNGSYKDGLPIPHPSFSTSTIYVSAPLGSLQGDSIRGIYGVVANVQSQQSATVPTPATNPPNVFTSVVRYTGNSAGGSPAYDLYFNASRVVPTSNENIPINYSVNYYIKY
ncbi:putative bacteriophage tail fiber protein, e14 prophage [Endomicrobium proavitum]|uniref:Putative bacteriophage tail fiber protein, e14 prophage n=1 Tax=Endomicrobium proavitum TaxID=1408281 RepID=A0A0G3WGX6_9BACT|nr:putative bacteriophage tail fiber protein, e14 prophage [Endomicrobium proavitum]